MDKVIVSDIFGRTPALEDLAKTIGSVIEIIDPYGGKPMDFHTELLAYEHFMAHVGIHTYEEILSLRLAEIPRVRLLIGFSVGAAAIWHISEMLSPEKIECAVCFYGSQIRHATDIVPRIRIEHILPRMEPGFSIDNLAAILSSKKNVTVHRTPYLHGFMNESSPNFSRTGYTAHVGLLR